MLIGCVFSIFYKKKTPSSEKHITKSGYQKNIVKFFKPKNSKSDFKARKKSFVFFSTAKMVFLKQNIEHHKLQHSQVLAREKKAKYLHICILYIFFPTIYSIVAPGDVPTPS